MRNIRKGNDTIHHWSILAKSGDTSVPYDLMGKNLTLLLAIGARETRVMDFSISANVLTFPYYGKDQDRTGNVTLTLIENEGLLDMHTLDKVDAYRLVAHSNEVGGEDTCSHLNMEVVNLASTLEGEIGPRGYSAYEIAVQNGFVGTEEEWLASLKGEQGEPGTTDYNELENKPDLSPRCIFYNWEKTSFTQKELDELRTAIRKGVPIIITRYYNTSMIYMRVSMTAIDGNSGAVTFRFPLYSGSSSNQKIIWTIATNGGITKQTFNTI